MCIKVAIGFFVLSIAAHRWTYAIVCKYAKYVRSNVELLNSRVEGRAFLGHTKRESNMAKKRDKEKERNIENVDKKNKKNNLNFLNTFNYLKYICIQIYLKYALNMYICNDLRKYNIYNNNNRVKQ